MEKAKGLIFELRAYRNELKKNINWTYPRACIDEVAGGSYRTQHGEHQCKDPHGNDDGEEGVVPKLALESEMRPGLQCDDEHEEGGGDVSEVDQEALSRAGGGAGDDVFVLEPMPAKEEAESLEEVGHEEVAEQDHEDILLDVFGVESVPS